jgi:hypothetical protein
MVPIACPAILASAATGIDVRHDPLSDPGWIIGDHDATHHLVTRHTTKAHVATRKLEIGVADACELDSDERLTRLTFGLRKIGLETCYSFEDETFQDGYSLFKTYTLFARARWTHRTRFG